MWGAWGQGQDFVTHVSNPERGKTGMQLILISLSPIHSFLHLSASLLIGSAGFEVLRDAGKAS